MNLTFIRDATPPDAPKIYNLIVLAYAEAEQQLKLPNGIAALKEGSTDILRDMHLKTLLVCTKNSDVIGTVRFRIFTQKDGAKLAYISRLCVLPDDQKNGTGSALLAEVEKRCRAQGVDMLSLHAPAAIKKLVRFYLKNGFDLFYTTTDRGYLRGLFVKKLTERKASLTPLWSL